MTNPAEITLDGIAVPPDRLRALRLKKVCELADSMRVQGLLQPIVLRPRDGAGYWLVAGWHRLEAARQLKWPAIAATICADMDAERAALAEIDENLIRADLTPAERALHLAERKRLYEKLHPQTRHGGDRRSGSSRQNGDLKRFTVDAARKVGKSERTVQRELQRATIPVLADVVGTSLDAADELDALAGLPESEQRALAALAKAGAKVTARHVAKKLRREERERDLAAATEAASQALGREVYGVIYADPPWRFEVFAESGKDLLPDNHYPTLSTEEIKTLKVPAAENAALFLWATVPMLPQALEVMTAWGFTYKSLLTWNKDRDGLG